MKIPSYAVYLSFLLFSCASSSRSGGGQVRGASFPSQEKVQKLAGAPLPALDGLGRFVAGRDLRGPFPDPIEPGPHPAAGVFEQRLLTVAKQQGLQTDASLACAAAEVGRFYLEESARPARPVMDFIAVRCSTQAASVQTAFVHGTVPEDVSDEKVLESWNANVTSMLSPLAGRGAIVGGWFGRAGEKAVFVVSHALRKGRIHAMRSEKGMVVLEGQLSVDAESVHAEFSYGELGVGTCSATPSTPLPQFALACPLPDGAPYIWVDVAERAPGRVLSSLTLGILVETGGKLPARSFDAPFLESKRISTQTELQQSVLQVTNIARARLGLSPLAFEPDQSALATQLTGSYFGAAYGSSGSEALDTIALGMMAGWSVQVDVANASFYAAMVPGTHDVADLMRAVLGRPFGRGQLLRPEAGRIALGPVISAEPVALGLILATYDVFEAYSPAQKKADLAQLLQATRSEIRRQPIRLDDVLGAHSERAAAEVRSGQRDPDRALRSALQSAAAATEVPVQGWVIESSELEGITFPKAVLTSPQGSLGIAVAHRAQKGSPLDALGRLHHWGGHRRGPKSRDERLA